MRAFKSVAVSVSISLALSGIAIAGTRLRVTGDGVSLRPVGDLNSEVLGSVNRGQVLEAVDWPGDGEWTSVRPPKDIKFWVFAELVADGTVDRTKVKVRGGPSVNYKPVDTLTKGDKVHVVGKTGDWLQIDPPDTAVVWINTRFVEPADGSAAARHATPAQPQPVVEARPAPEIAADAPPPPPPLPPPVEDAALPPLTLPPVEPESVSAPVAPEPAPVAVAAPPAPRVEPPSPRAEPSRPRELPAPVESPAIASMPSSRPDPSPATSFISTPRERPATVTAREPVAVSRPASAPVTAARPTATTPRAQAESHAPASAPAAAARPVATTPRAQAESNVPVAAAAATAPVASATTTPPATARRRYRAVTPRSYPQQQAPTRSQPEFVPAPGSTRVSYSGEITGGGKLTITNRGEYRLVTRDAQDRAITLCFLSGPAEQFESLRGETVKVEGYQVWNTGARRPTVHVDSILRTPSTVRER